MKAVARAKAAVEQLKKAEERARAENEGVISFFGWLSESFAALEEENKVMSVVSKIVVTTLCDDREHFVKGHISAMEAANKFGSCIEFESVSVFVDDVLINRVKCRLDGETGNYFYREVDINKPAKNKRKT
jgi:hypothetical protein